MENKILLLDIILNDRKIPINKDYNKPKIKKISVEYNEGLNIDTITKINLYLTDVKNKLVYCSTPTETNAVIDKYLKNKEFKIYNGNIGNSDVNIFVKVSPRKLNSHINVNVYSVVDGYQNTESIKMHHATMCDDLLYLCSSLIMYVIRKNKEV